uniref:glutamate--tRNA ligase n=1 Tax=Syphacia muris TaxID=451379 RepID=A0A0N5AX29_9BILA
MVLEKKVTRIKISRKNPAYGTLLALAAAGFNVEESIEQTDCEENELVVDGIRLTDDIAIARFIVRSCECSSKLFGKDAYEQAQVESWLCLIERGFVFDGILNLALQKLQRAQYLCLGHLTLADLILWVALADKLKDKCQQLKAFFDRILRDPRLFVAHKLAGKYSVLEKVHGNPQLKKTSDKKNPVETTKEKSKTKDVGKFVDLPGAEKGKVVVRFPPEASGYLHIGHAKAALLNQYYQQVFEGQLIMRFDDTNPAKESAHFEKVILEDLEMLEVKPDRWSHSSDYFDVILGYCEKLLQEGKAYVDETDAETMRKEREERKESKYRNASVEQNLKLWNEMKKGSPEGQKCCVRIKIDMNSNNGAMRDPTIYRCKNESHVRTGNKYKVYPTYDFTCPIVDSIEGVTHALRTTEYTDRDEQYYYICDVLKLRKPYIWSYARLNMTNTVMSKRKLTWFVQENIVDGWDDPRFPTVRGTLRRGLTVEGLKQFILAQGGSRSVVTMEWDKIWAFNKKVIDPIVPRYAALDVQQPLVPVYIKDDVREEQRDVQLHPKDIKIGMKPVWFGKKIMVEKVDAQLMNEGDTVTFINWGNMKISSVEKDNTDHVVAIKASLDLDNKDFKKTLKVMWIADVNDGAMVPIQAVKYDHIISKPIVGKDEDWKQFINCNSKHYSQMMGEPAIKSLKKGDIIQIQRKGYYICDCPFESKSGFSEAQIPLVLIEIPDGSKTSTKEEQQQKSHSNQQCKSSKSTDSTSLKRSEVNNGADTDDLYKQVEDQGNLVRTLKAKDAKSDETKAAIARLLELKALYKSKTGQDYKPNSKPNNNKSNHQKEEESALSNSNELESSDLYKQVEDQGNLVRTLKAKDAKSDETKAAIARLLELKALYKSKTGQDYKPNSKPKNNKSNHQKEKESTLSNSNELESSDLYKQVEDQGNLVRTLKAKDAKSDETKAAIARLLELKALYKSKTGQDYKPKPKPN